MTNKDIRLISTGIRNLDTILGGGIPLYSMNIIAGSPGGGKTILAQQILFETIRRQPNDKTLYLTTLSEPMLKVVRYGQRLNFFDADQFGERVIYHDIGSFIYEQPLSGLVDHILQRVNQSQAQVLVIDSFKAIRDSVDNPVEFRRFCYLLSVRLASARCTSFLITESDCSRINHDPEFAIADGIIYLFMAEQNQEQRRFLQVYKLRGMNPKMNPIPFTITADGVQVFTSALAISQQPIPEKVSSQPLSTGIFGLDCLLQGGIPQGYSVMVSGFSGAGKTTLALQFLLQGVEAGETGLLFYFEDSRHSLDSLIHRLGWDLASLEAQGWLTIISIPHPQIRLEEQLEQIREAIQTLKPKRFVIDSFSVFLSKTEHHVIQREKTYIITTLIQQVGAVGLLISDQVIDDSQSHSHFGVQGTVVDGILVLSSAIVPHLGFRDGIRRYRYLEVLKMRSVNHITGRHRMHITPTGIEVLYLKATAVSENTSVIPKPLQFSLVQDLVQEQLRFNQAWLVQGEPGLGKSILGLQFAIEGLQHQDSVLYISADVRFHQVCERFSSLNLLPQSYLQSGQLVILDPLSPGKTAISLSDPEFLLYILTCQLEQMSKPCRIIFDSLVPVAINCSVEEFLSFIDDKNRLLNHPDVVLLDIWDQRIGITDKGYSLWNTFDGIINLSIPDWGEMNQRGNRGYPTLQLQKLRGSLIDPRPYPYKISLPQGIVLQNYYD
ncbi:MAG: ATPase domain-containing protein [Coleofasciculus sp. B1-GNL1-01]|uniref:RAD55 family ATPase n=1 Tax=Coleofasciculus sp. B1-GNL1-01 TaxID=3068484 RepID=UPI0033028AB4